MKIKNGATVCTKEDLFFHVELQKEKLQCNKEYSMKVVGRIGGKRFLLNQCSDVYRLIKNVDIFPNIESAFEDNKIQYSVSYRHINHVRFYADYVITDQKYAYTMQGTNDLIYPKLSVQHSYNGLTKYKILFGYFRLVCTNGLTIPVAEMQEFNLCMVGKHTEAIENSLGKLSEMLQHFAENASVVLGAITSKYELLNANVIDHANFNNRLTEILEASKITMIDNANYNTVNDIVMRVNEEANKPNLGYDGKITDWLIYNGINQYLHDDNRNIVVPEIRMEKDLYVLEYMLAN